jgi:hypothetical protein
LSASAKPKNAIFACVPINSVMTGAAFYKKPELPDRELLNARILSEAISWEILTVMRTRNFIGVR